MNHKNNKPLTSEVRAEIQARVRRGEKKVHVAKSLGISHSVVRKYTDPVAHQISDAIRDKALEMLREGHTRSHTARTLMVSRKWVSEIAPIPGHVPKKIAETTRAEIARRANSGETIAKISRDLKIGEGTVAQIARNALQHPTEAEIAQAKTLRARGLAINVIATSLQWPLMKVRLAVGKSTFVRYTPAEKLQMAQLVSEGLPMAEIALRCGASAGVITGAYKNAVKSGQVVERITLAMEDDLDLLRIQRLYPQLQAWREYVVRYFKVVKGNFAVVCTALNRFLEYLVEKTPFTDPRDYLLRKNSQKIPKFWDVACVHSDHGAALNNAVVDFLDWILIQAEFADLDDPTDPVTLTEFKNPLHYVERNDHRAQRGAESNKTVMPYWLIHDLRRRIAQGPSFSDWKWVQGMSGKLTLTGELESRSWFEVDPVLIDKNDPDCVWRVRSTTTRLNIIEMWSPVRWVACLVKLQLTARMGQIRMLDSGEADTLIYKSGRAVKNATTIAQGSLRSPRRQGMLRLTPDETLVLYFNTNKTLDRSKKGSEKGQECAWPKLAEFPDDPYYWLEKLRDWQMKYNPSPGAIPWKEIPSARRLKGKSEQVCMSYPDAVFAFRTPESRGFEQYPVAPGTIDKAWQSIFKNYEDELAATGKTNADGSPIKLVSEGRSQISPHGLRVSLITHLILDGDVPPEIMMKVVGHARFIMTIYYTKPGLSRIEDAIQNAVKRLDDSKDETLVRDLASQSNEMLRNSVVFNSDEITDVIPLNPAERNPLGWLPMHDGICLAGGNTGSIGGNARVPGCHNGGPPVAAAINLHGPVPGGIRNCARCRWKCAGQHHLLGLQATLNNRQYHLHKEGDKAVEASRKRDDLLRQKALTEARGEPFLPVKELRDLERRFEVAMQRLENLTLDVAAIHKIIERIVALPHLENGRTALAAQGDLTTIHAVIDATESELLVLAEVCADVEFFPELEPGTAIFEFAQLLDSAFEREGRPLLLSKMPEKEMLVAANAVMRELERHANLKNSVLARKKVIEVIDRGESLQVALGVRLEDIALHASDAIEVRQIGDEVSLALINEEQNDS